MGWNSKSKDNNNGTKERRNDHDVEATKIIFCTS